MSERTVMQNKLARAIEQTENNEVILSHLASFLREVETRLNQLENSVLKMDSAFETNPITGDKTAQAIVKVLIETRH
jgi:hypothetical protein